MAAGVLMCAMLAPTACNGGNKVAARVSCYPSCLADVVQICPMLSACDVVPNGSDPNIPNPDVRNGQVMCFATGERQWQAVNATSGDSYILVKHADDSECYTAIAAAGSTHYTLSVGGRTFAELDAPSQTGSAMVTCVGAQGDAGTTSAIVETPACPWAPWTNVMTCGSGPCQFGVIPPGADAGMALIRD